VKHGALAQYPVQYQPQRGHLRMRKVRRFNISRVVRGGFAAAMSAAIMYGGVGALVQPASATVPPAGTEPNVTYSLSSPVLSFPVTPIGSSSSVTETIVANFVTTTSTTLDPAGIVFDSGTAAPDPTDFTVTGGCVNVALNFFGQDS